MPRFRRSSRAIGPIDGRDVEKVIPVPESDDSIVLLDIDATPGQKSNLLRIRPDDSIVWRAAEPPDTEPRSVGAW